MLISTIIICRNSIAYIERCIQSVRAQRFQTSELIVVDGQSEDGTAEYLALQNQIFIIDQQGKGIANARNTGILAAKGEYIAFLDADDVWTPEKLEVQYQYLFNNPAIDAAGGQLVKSDNIDYPIPAMTPGGFLFRSKVFEQFGLFNEKFKIACDHEWFLRAIRGGLKHHKLTDIVLKKEMHADSYSAVYKSEYRKEMMEIFRTNNQ